MEAFEDWRKQKLLHSFAEDAARRGWKAALEWFYKNLGYSTEHEELKDLIERELDGSKNC